MVELDGSEPRKRPAARAGRPRQGGPEPSHPVGAASLLMIAVTLLLVALAVFGARSGL